MDYDGNTKRLKVFGSETATKPASALLERSVLLEQLFSGNDLFVGFTAGTGGARNEHVVKSFSMSSQPSTSTTGPVADYGTVIPATTISLTSNMRGSITTEPR